ncbi:transglutaminase domain-containing protein [Paradesertivirga mongoliensis]|uniref:Transglutaminase domain-containing protein n=1 Tax=Paradesertivirga mongoliensis TaxID=2100740 RepID=A0ABW4ZN49_9SPHI|nr:DUF3857 domain-containing protein [Pedobacter mongoliensis]
MKKILFTAGFMILSMLSDAQDFTFGKPTAQQFELKRYDKDTSAAAVVLKEYGKAYISNNDLAVVFEYHVRIKIFNSKGYNSGNVEIPLRKSDANTFEKVRDIKGITFFVDENNLIRNTELEAKQIFKESKAGKYHDLVKFAMPNVKDGSIIEYSYVIESPYRFNFRTWEFQSDIPKAYSEFCAVIPGVYNYNVSIRGPLRLTRDEAVLEKECFSPGGGWKADCSKLTYIMENVPAFVEEDYMTAASNFKSAMYFELSDYSDYRGAKHKVTKEWKDVDRELKTDESFGLQLKRKDFFKDRLEPVVAGKTSDIDKAKAIYTFIKSQYKWNHVYGCYAEEGIKKSFEKRSGNVGDINLALVAAMNSAEIKAEPIILSTRSNGTVNTLFPVLSDFNYVICRVTIDETSYMLDATDPLLPFGLLPIRCMNDKGRLVSLDKPSSWIDLSASQKEHQTVTMKLSMDNAGKIKGTMDILSSGYEAYNKRVAIKKFNSVDEYVEDLDERLPKVKFIKSQIFNLDTLESGLRESFEIEITNTEKDQFYLNPFFMDRNSSNPFKLAERTYPVDLGSPSESRMVVQMTFPDNFDVTNKPKSAALALPNNGGKFISDTKIEGNTLMLNSIVQLSRPIYTSEEYHYLKALFTQVSQVKNTNITFKKKI